MRIKLQAHFPFFSHMPASDYFCVMGVDKARKDFIKSKYNIPRSRIV